MNINIPEGFELAAPLNEECIWIQARGSAAEVSKSEMTESEQKVIKISFFLVWSLSCISQRVFYHFGKWLWISKSILISSI